MVSNKVNSKIGFIGLGIMGKPMVQNLLAAGYQVAVYARNPKSTEGVDVTFYETPKLLADNVDVLISCVSDTPDVEQLCLSENGVIASDNSNLIVVDMSTIAADASKNIAEQLEQRGISMLDAPVSGGQIGAEQGSLTIMVGGKPDVLEKVEPILKVLGNTITWIGNYGAGQVAKACNNLLVATTVLGIGEAFKLSNAYDVDFAKVREALLGGFAQSRALDVHGQRLIDDNFEPGFMSKLHLKDTKIALHLAQQTGLDLKNTKQVEDMLQQVIDRGMEEKDSSIIATLV